MKILNSLKIQNNNPIILLSLIIASVVILTVVGIVFVYSSSNLLALKLTNNHLFFFFRHILAIIVGIIACLIFRFISIEFLFKHRYKLGIICLLILIAVFIPFIGKKVLGANRWLQIGFISFQPSEIAKLLIILYLIPTLSKIIDKNINDQSQGSHQSFSPTISANKTHRLIQNIPYFKFLQPIIIAFSSILLVLIEPDFSTAVIFFTVVIYIFIFFRMSIIYLLSTISLFIPFLLIFLEKKVYILKRFLSLFSMDYVGTKNYQILKSLQAFKDGFFFGTGLGKSEQNIYLPEAHNDFIFSIIAEETGIIGILLVIFCFGIFFISTLKLSEQVKKEYKLLLHSIVIISFSEFMIHLYVTIGIFPITGIPLPFISYGRTSIVIHFIFLGIISHIALNSKCFNHQSASYNGAKLKENSISKYILPTR